MDPVPKLRGNLIFAFEKGRPLRVERSIPITGSICSMLQCSLTIYKARIHTTNIHAN